MIIQKINLQNFRNYSKKTFEFSEGINLIVGDNAVGKTNLLEAIYLLASGKSFRIKSVEREMIGYGEEIARVMGGIRSEKREVTVNSVSGIDGVKGREVRSEGGETNLEIVLTTGEVQGEKAGKKKYLVNGVAKRAFDFLGNFRAVYFGPEDLELVTDSPSLRRKYLDMVLSQTDREYARCVLVYEKGIRARNKILEGIREEGRGGMWDMSREVGSETGDYKRRLYFWDQLVIKNGDILTRKRGEYIDFLNENLLRRPLNNFKGANPVNFSENLWDKGNAFSSNGGYFCIEYDKSLISDERLKQYEREEVASATTLVGPHRDDFRIKISNYKIQMTNQIQNSKLQTKNVTDNYIDSGFHRNDGGRDLSVYGSRGEQRLAILWLKLGELAYILEKTGDQPTLLLDDIFSELDEEHRELVMELINNQQTILTTADKEVIDLVLNKDKDKVNLINISNVNK